MKRFFSASIFLLLVGIPSIVLAQRDSDKQQVRTVTIPISIFTKKELKESQAEEFIQAERLTVTEDKEEQQILSIRSVGNTPLSIAFLIQDDLAANFNLQIPEIKNFILGLPKGTRVMIAYARSGSPQIAQRFTDDLERAAAAVRIVSSSSTLAPRSPFDGVQDILGKFDGVPSGRRAILLFSDGLDTSEGLNLASISQSFALGQAIVKAQRRSVAVYSFYAPTTVTENGNSTFILAAQGALAKLSEQTGGRSFYQGSLAAVSYLPYFKDLILSLNRQFALTYLSTHMNKGYHRITVQSTNPDIKIQHPVGYYYR